MLQMLFELIWDSGWYRCLIVNIQNAVRLQTQPFEWVLLLEGGMGYSQTKREECRLSQDFAYYMDHVCWIYLRRRKMLPD